MTTAKPEPDSLEKIIHEMRQNVGPQPPIMHGAMWDILQWAARLESLRGAKVTEPEYTTMRAPTADEALYYAAKACRHFAVGMPEVADALDKLRTAPPERFSKEEKRALEWAARAAERSPLEAIHLPEDAFAATLRFMLGKGKE